MLNDKEMPNNKDNDRDVFEHLDYATAKNWRAERIYKKMKREYLKSKQEEL